MAGEIPRLHVVMFPWLAFGHIIPFLELSKFIAQKGHRVTFVSTPKTIVRLRKLYPDLSSSIMFLGLALPRVEGLPEDVEATVDVGSLDHSLLKKAYDGLEPELTRFLENSLPDCIIIDFASYWLPPVAARLRISKFYFNILSASSVVFFGPFDLIINDADPRTKAEDFTVPPPWVTFDTKVAFKLHESSNFMAQALSIETKSGVNAFHRLGYTIMGSDAIFVRQCNEFEGQWVKLLEELQQRPVIPVGLMPPHVEENSLRGNETWVSIKEWLDTQEKASVVYVAFGSEVAMSQIELTELALGLESSGVPFFWVLRKLTNSIDLPIGFDERVKGRGIVWRSWAPQLNVLSHGSVGGFLTHCGWSSVIEGLMFGHPLIMLPSVLDTGLIARVMEKEQVGVEIPRNEQDGSYTRDSVADSLRLVMVKNEGKTYKAKSKEICDIFGNRELQDGYIHRFIDYLENHVNKSEQQ